MPINSDQFPAAGLFRHNSLIIHSHEYYCQ